MIEYWKNLSLENLFYIAEDGRILEEEWILSKEFPEYKVSNLGRLKSLDKLVSHYPSGHRLRKGKILKQKLHLGYLSVSLYKDGVQNTKRSHRVILNCFLKNINNKLEVNHINGIKSDNRIENLEWASRSENAKHAYEIGLQKIAREEMVNGSKLKEIDILYIRKMKKVIKQSELAIRYGVSVSCISAIQLGRNWSHV